MIAPPRPPSRDELEALIKEARARQLRRRLVGAAGVALAAAIGLGVHVLATSGSSDRSAGSAPNAPAGAPLCRSSQLSAKAFWGGAAGSAMGAAVIFNKGTTPCSLLSGRPSVRITWGHTPLPIRDLPPTRGEFPWRPLRRLAPGSRGAVFMQWTNWCAKPRAGALTTISLLFHGGVRVAARNVSGQPPCANAAQPSKLRASRLELYR